MTSRKLPLASLLPFSLALTLLAPSAFAAETIRANVKGMICSFCAQGVEKKFRKVSAVDAVHVDLKQGIVVLNLKDGQKLPDEQIRTTIRDSGYETGEIQRESK